MAKLGKKLDMDSSVQKADPRGGPVVGNSGKKLGGETATKLKKFTMDTPDKSGGGWIKK
jgi:hypothetical protein